MHKQSAYILVLAVAVLVTLGLVMLYSTGALPPIVTATNSIS